VTWSLQKCKREAGETFKTEGARPDSLLLPWTFLSRRQFPILAWRFIPPIHRAPWRYIATESRQTLQSKLSMTRERFELTTSELGHLRYRHSHFPDSTYGPTPHTTTTLV
jgi:hypothetical protein